MTSPGNRVLLITNYRAYVKYRFHCFETKTRNTAIRGSAWYPVSTLHTSQTDRSDR